MDHVINECLCSILVFPVQHICGLYHSISVTKYLFQSRKKELYKTIKILKEPLLLIFTPVASEQVQHHLLSHESSRILLKIAYRRCKKLSRSYPLAQMDKSLDRFRAVMCRSRHTLLADLLNKKMPKEAGKSEEQSGTSAERRSESEQQHFPFPFSFSLLLTCQLV